MFAGIPVEKVSSDETEEAVVAISRAIRRARVGLKNPNRPIASFIFSGPTGPLLSLLDEQQMTCMHSARLVRRDINCYLSCEGR
jgi:hypothetical protein